MKTLSILGAALLVSAASAQSTKPAVTGQTMTEIHSAVSLNKAMDKAMVKKGSKFTRYLRSRAQVRGGYVSTYASAGKHHSRRKHKTYYYASLSNYGRIYGRNASDKGAASVNDGAKTPGQFKVAYKFDLPKNVKGKFYVSLYGRTSKNSMVALTATVGKNKPVMWSNGKKYAKAEFSYDFAKGPVVVQLWAKSKMSLSGKARESFSARGSVSFVPQQIVVPPVKLTVTPGKANCGGTLAGKVDPKSPRFANIVHCKLSKAQPNALGVVLLSPNGKTISFGKCRFFNNVYGIMGIFRTDKSGMAQHRLYLPRNKKFTVYVQDVVLKLGRRGPSVTASNDLKIQSK